MHKRLKFASPLVPLILSGEKISTWRLWDDKNLSIGDVIDFYEFGEDTTFATATVTEVIEKPLGSLTQDDKKGHEQFANDEEMYQTYAKYYAREVNAKTIVKIIWFRIETSDS